MKTTQKKTKVTGIAMDTRNRLKIKVLAASVGLAAMQMGAMSAANADSGIGQDTTMGNALNLRPVNAATYGNPLDPEGMGTNAPVAHTPSGQMYSIPSAPEESSGKADSVTGHVEIGVIGAGGDKKAQGFKRYKDVSNGLYLSNFGISAEKPDQARFFEITGGGVARDDQFYSLNFGRYNDWKVSAFYNETTHTFSTNYRSLWSGIGTSNLSVLPGANLGAAVPATGNLTVGQASTIAAAASANVVELGLVREKGGARFDMTLTDSWKVFASYSLENRKGARPFGMAEVPIGGGPGNGHAFEVAEPIDYKTHDWIAGFQYADDLSSFNAVLNASLFRNNIDTLTVGLPYTLQSAATSVTSAGAGGVANINQSRFDLVPNNDFYSIKLEYARSLPDFYNGAFTAVASASTSRQNDNLIPWTTVPGLTVVGTTGGAWDTTASLSKTSAGAKIDSRLIDLGLSLKPTNDLSVKGKLRFQQTINDTKFYACNPSARYVDNNGSVAGGAAGGINAFGCNGVWGRLGQDGLNLAGLFGNNNQQTGAPAPAAVVSSTPFDNKRLTYSLAGDYRLGKSASVNASWEHENFKRDEREISETKEDSVKLGYVNRNVVEGGTLRLSYEDKRRRGGTYADKWNETVWGGSLYPYIPGFTPTAAQLAALYATLQTTGFQKYDISDRNQGILNARFNYMIAPDLDGMISLQMKDSKYPQAVVGRNSDSQNTLNLELNYQPSSETNVHGFYSYQTAKLRQSNNTGNIAQTGTAACLAAPSTALCNRAINPATVWDADNDEKNDMFGFGFMHDFGSARLNVDFTRSTGGTRISYKSRSGAVMANTGDLPEMKFTQNILTANLLVPVSKTTSVRAFYQYETGSYNDWHYDTGVSASPNPTIGVAANTNNWFILDGGPQNYKAHLIGLMFSFKM